MAREQFIERVWQWKEESGGTISRQMRRLGDSVDWTRDRSRWTPACRGRSPRCSCDCTSEGLIYRGKRLVNWDPVLLTALSDLEVVGAEEDGHLWHLSYPLEDGSGHRDRRDDAARNHARRHGGRGEPEDERYRHLIGSKLRLPLSERLIPIIADDYVDPAFGSGCVKITPAHDFNDYESASATTSPQINILTPRRHDQRKRAGALSSDSIASRRASAIVAELEQAGLLARIDRHRHIVPRGDRSGAVLEPYLTDQWYVKVASRWPRPAIAAVHDGRTRFVPENWSTDLLRVDAEHPGLVHQPPVVVGPPDSGLVRRRPATSTSGADEAEARRAMGWHAGGAADPGHDVLDTWFSSALWPFSTLGWPEQRRTARRFYPTNVLVTGFDIIFFWVARMIMMGLKFTGEVPFREVYVTA